MTPQQLVYKSKSWRDLKNKLSKLKPKDRGTAFEWFCVFYLQVEPIYRTTYRRVLHSSEFLKESSIKKILGFTQNKEEGADAIKVLLSALPASSEDDDESMQTLRRLQQAQHEGIDIQYRCPKCRDCPSCRRSHETERISLREEAEDLMIGIL